MLNLSIAPAGTTAITPPMIPPGQDEATSVMCSVAPYGSVPQLRVTGPPPPLDATAAERIHHVVGALRRTFFENDAADELDGLMSELALGEENVFGALLSAVDAHAAVAPPHLAARAFWAIAEVLARRAGVEGGVRM